MRNSKKIIKELRADLSITDKSALNSIAAPAVIMTTMMDTLIW